MIVVVLKQEGTVLRLRQRLNMEVRISVSSLAHALRACSGLLSGPAGLRGLILLRTLFTWADDKTGGSEEGLMVQVSVSLLSVLGQFGQEL